MKNQSDDPLENFFQSEFEGYEKKASMEPFKSILAKHSSQKILINTLAVIIGLLFLTGLSVYIMSSAINEHKEEIESKNEQQQSLKQTNSSIDQIEKIVSDNNDSSLLGPIISTKPNNDSYIKKNPLIANSDNQKIQIQYPNEHSKEIAYFNSLNKKSNTSNHSIPNFPKLNKVETNINKTVIVKKIRTKTKSALYIQVLPMLLYNDVSPNQNDELLIDDFQAQDPLSLKRMGLRTSINYEYLISNKIRVIAGTSLFLKKMALTYNTINYVLDSSITTQLVPGIGIEVKTQSRDTITNSQEFDFTSKNIGFHAGVIFQINKYHQLGLNIESQKLIGSNSEGRHLGIEDRNYLYLHYLYEFPINEKVTFNVQPTISYSFDRMNFNGPISIKPYGIGLGIGMRYKLFKLKKVSQGN